MVKSMTKKKDSFSKAVNLATELGDEKSSSKVVSVPSKSVQTEETIDVIEEVTDNKKNNINKKKTPKKQKKERDLVDIAKTSVDDSINIVEVEDKKQPIVAPILNPPASGVLEIFGGLLMIIIFVEIIVVILLLLMIFFR